MGTQFNPTMVNRWRHYLDSFEIFYFFYFYGSGIGCSNNHDFNKSNNIRNNRGKDIWHRGFKYIHFHFDLQIYFPSTAT